MLTVKCIIQPYSKRFISDIKDVLRKNIAIEREKVKKFRQSHGNTKIGEINVNMLYLGMRGMTALIYETSELHPEKGIRFRGLEIEDCYKKLPREPDTHSPLPEGVFWLLLTGEVPTLQEIQSLSEELAQRSFAPTYALNLIKTLPINIHPMAQLSAVAAVMHAESQFMRAYSLGAPKTEYWEHIFEDSLNLIAQLPILAATLYRRLYKGDEHKLAISEVRKDWACNFAHLLGFAEPEFIDLLRLYLVLHCDHEGGNVSAHATHLVGSALSSPYLAYAAGMNGLAGPLHGLANQEVLMWMLTFQKQVGDSYTDDQLKDYVKKTLKDGRVIPGYGHAVLRRTDPRYECFRKFALKHFEGDTLFKICEDLLRVVPPILKDLGKVQNPWPNMDAISGVMLHHYGLTEYEFYTVMFGVSRALGILSSLIWARALSFPIERPKSISTVTLIDRLGTK